MISFQQYTSYPHSYVEYYVICVSKFAQLLERAVLDASSDAEYKVGIANWVSLIIEIIAILYKAKFAL